MKKVFISFITFILCLSLCAVALVSCNSGDNATDGTTRPDPGRPEDTVPGTEAPNTGKPEDTVPGTEAPDTGKPEDTVPGTEAPNTGKPEDTVPGTAAPDTGKPEDTTPPAPHTHSFGDWETVKDPSCSEEGKKERACSCGTKETDIIKKLEHKEEILPAVAPTAKEEGLTEGKKCSVCGTVLVKQETVPVLKPVIWEGNIANSFAGGSGSFKDPYLIATGDQLAFLAASINGSNDNKYYDKYYRLINDINLGGLEWTPIGIYTYSSGQYSMTRSFCGVFDGDGYTVSNFKITDNSTSYHRNYGLFGYIIEGTVKNIGVKDFDINISATENSYFGGLAGECSGVLLNCYAENGSINLQSTKASLTVGGLVGASMDKMTNCHASSIELYADTVSASAGALVGYISKNASALGCFAEDSSVTVHGKSVEAGGLVGSLKSSLQSCYADVNIEAEATADAYAGGLVGKMSDSATVRDCYAKGSVIGRSADTAYIGGLIGYGQAYIISTAARAYASGDVTAVGARVYAGGFMGGSKNANIYACYSTGSVTVTADVYFVGPLIGAEQADAENCYVYVGSSFTVNGEEVEFNGLGDVCDAELLNSNIFHTETLEFDSKLWELASLDTENGKLARLIISDHIHTEFTLEGSSPNCTQDGLSNGSLCEICGETVVPQEIIPALGHTEVITPGKAPTCHSNGFTESISCSVCYEVVKESTALAFSEHTYSGNLCEICGAHISYVFEGDQVFLDLHTNNGVYFNFDAYPIMISVTVPNPFLDGLSLKDMVEDTENYGFNTEMWPSLLDEVNEYGYAPLTTTTLKYIMSVMWVENKSELYGDEFFACLLGYYDESRHIHAPIKPVTPPTCADSDIHYACATCGEEFVYYAPDHSYTDGVCTGCGRSKPIVWDGSVADGFAGGSGTANDPYLISGGEHLAYLEKEINSGKGFELSDKYFLLTCNIDLDGREWNPIGCYYMNSGSYTSNNYAFNGHFNGGGNEISNFKITSPAEKYYGYFGLFGYIYERALVENLRITDFEINVEIKNQRFIYVGGLAGLNAGTVQNCYTKGTITAYNNYFSNSTLELSAAYAGGLVGGCSTYTSSVIDCYSTVDVTSRGNAHAYAGGLVGASNNSVTGSHASGSVTAEGSNKFFDSFTRPNSVAGGLIGTASSHSTVENCYATGNVRTRSEHASEGIAGGLIGSNSGKVIGCHAEGNVDTEHFGITYGGGLIGFAKDTSEVSGCYATGTVKANSEFANSDSSAAGGLIGHAEGKVMNSYATGDVYASGHNYDSNGGGLIGEAFYSDATVENCYATGNVTADNCGGGLIGKTVHDVTVKNCYATGNVTAGEGGGLIGSTYSDSNNDIATVVGCFSVGNVEGLSDMGKFIGSPHYGVISDKNFYFEGVTVTDWYGEIVENECPYSESCTADQLSSVSFYTDQLGWDSTVWNLSDLDLESGKLPTLISK